MNVMILVKLKFYKCPVLNQQLHQLLGDSILGAKKWMLSIEGRVVLKLSDHSDFIFALAVLFEYYMFNIEYPEEVATSPEFIQS